MLPIDESLFAALTDFRRDLHRHPELSWKEKRTSERICAFLDTLPGVTYRSQIAGYGILAEIGGDMEGQRVALRADMDALPVVEETELAFASTNPGVMHACGHDAHMTMLLGAASLLSKQSSLTAPVRLIFQPAEETGDGARAMIEAGALEDVGMIFGGHVDRHYPTGSIVVTDGPVNASSDRFTIRVRGRGGHAARPHETVDAVVVGSLFVMAVQTIVSREINPAHPSVVTVGRFDAGTASNVIADQALLEGTIRAQEPEVRDSLDASIQRIAKSIAQLHGAQVDVEIHKGTPALINRGIPTEIARKAAADVVPPDYLLAMETANMGGEDFSYYVEEVPGCYVRYGSMTDERHAFPAHSSRFDIDEAALAYGASYLNRVALIAGEHLAGIHEYSHDSQAESLR